MLNGKITELGINVKGARDIVIDLNGTVTLCGVEMPRGEKRTVSKRTSIAVDNEGKATFKDREMEVTVGTNAAKNALAAGAIFTGDDGSNAEPIVKLTPTGIEVKNLSVSNYPVIIADPGIMPVSASAAPKP